MAVGSRAYLTEWHSVSGSDQPRSRTQEAGGIIHHTLQECQLIRARNGWIRTANLLRATRLSIFYHWLLAALFHIQQLAV